MHDTRPNDTRQIEREKEKERERELQSERFAGVRTVTESLTNLDFRVAALREQVENGFGFAAQLSRAQLLLLLLLFLGMLNNRRKLAQAPTHRLVPA